MSLAFIFSPETLARPSNGGLHMWKNFWNKIRPNVLFLFLVSYATITFIFYILACTIVPPAKSGQIPAALAYEYISGPLMALIGGTIAVAKDLIQDDETRTPGSPPPPPTTPEKDKQPIQDGAANGEEK